MTPKSPTGDKDKDKLIRPDIGFKIVCQTMMILKCPLLMNGNCLKKSIWKQPEISSKQKIGHNCYYMGNKMLSTLADTRSCRAI